MTDDSRTRETPPDHDQIQKSPDKPGRRRATADPAPGDGTVDKAKVAEFGERGMGVAAKE